ncbi:hypothetical protein BKD09_42085 [Bradyrhizobium japonicum]|uniref:Uncharacterized protein n=1 Tax=Bradyrhizobium japonicum TaxID=375 RepID=A0A1L3FP11_BRAJP|nr:hypothetical protein [Bradyrhizobium japonicum]APG14932.1 hypothetical protein BKD09_42085 [Bradyrhizobium japonicum]
MRYAMSLRAPGVLPLNKEVDWTIGERPEVARYLAMVHLLWCATITSSTRLTRRTLAREAASYHVYHEAGA